jgi:hypothetical protein
LTLEAAGDDTQMKKKKKVVMLVASPWPLNEWQSKHKSPWKIRNPFTHSKNVKKRR